MKSRPSLNLFLRAGFVLCVLILAFSTFYFLSSESIEISEELMVTFDIGEEDKDDPQKWFESVKEKIRERTKRVNGRITQATKGTGCSLELEPAMKVAISLAQQKFAHESDYERTMS